MSAHTPRRYAYQKLRAQVLAQSDVCWLCGHAGAREVDHVVPARYLSEAEKYDVRNLRPAHGTSSPCPHGCGPCNQRRNRRTPPPPPRPDPPPSRKW